jgi:hypothetical protein
LSPALVLHFAAIESHGRIVADGKFESIGTNAKSRRALLFVAPRKHVENFTRIFRTRGNSMRTTLVYGLTAVALLIGVPAAMGKTFCKGTVDTATGTEMWSDKNCEAEYPKKTVIVRECDERGKCPITDPYKGLACNSAEPRDTTRYFSCELSFSSITQCAPLKLRPQ